MEIHNVFKNHLWTPDWMILYLIRLSNLRFSVQDSGLLGSGEGAWVGCVVRRS